MIVASSFYWNVAFGAVPGDVLNDEEGLSIARNLARNMAWLLHMKEATKDTVPPPEAYPRAYTNFIR